MSIGLVLAVVMFSQMGQPSDVVQAADVAQNDLDFMDTADAVVKHYKATSDDSYVYIYARDSDLNTNHSGTTTWASALDGMPVILGVATAGGTDTDRAAATYSNVVTTSAGSGKGLKLDVRITGSGVADWIRISEAGTGYAAAEVVTVAGALIGHATLSDDLVLTVASVEDNDRTIDADGTWTIDGDTAIVSSGLRTTGACTAGTIVAADMGAASTAAAYTLLETSSSISGQGLVATITIDANDDAALTAITAGGTGYAVGEVVTVNYNQAPLSTVAATFTCTTIAEADEVATNISKNETSNQGVSGGPDLYLGDATPLKDSGLTVKQGGSSKIFDDRNDTNGTFSLTTAPKLGATANTDDVKASYSFHAQDVYPGGSTGSKRVHVTSSSDATGEWLLIKEVSDEGVTNNELDGGITAGRNDNNAGTFEIALDNVQNETEAARTAGTYVFHDGGYTRGGTGKGASFQVVVDSAG